MERENYHLFDLLIKNVLEDTGSYNMVYLVNALFGRQYPKEAPVTFRKTESVTLEGTKLKPYRSDMIVGIGEDDFVIEFQTSDDEIIGLRIFEYGFKYADSIKHIEGKGQLIEFIIPEGCVIFWESTEKTPDNIKLRIRQKNSDKVFDYDVTVFKLEEKSLEQLEELKLLVLLPFYIMRFRSELEKKSVSESAEKRRALAEEEKKLLGELRAILERSLEQGFISSGDQIKLLHKHIFNA